MEPPLEHLIDLVEHKDVLIATLNGETDLTTGDGRFQARILVSVAAKSSDDASRRLKRAMLQRAEHGDPHGGRVFGWKAGNIDLDPAEAPAAREMVDRALTGESMEGIAKSLNRRGILTPRTRKPWTGTLVRFYLKQPRLAGLRVRQGEVIGKARWEPVIDEATHEKLKQVLEDRGLKAMTPPRRRLLTGIVRLVAGGGATAHAQRAQALAAAHEVAREAMTIGSQSLAAYSRDLATAQALARKANAATAEAAQTANQLAAAQSPASAPITVTRAAGPAAAEHTMKINELQHSLDGQQSQAASLGGQARLLAQQAATRAAACFAHVASMADNPALHGSADPWTAYLGVSQPAIATE